MLLYLNNRRHEVVHVISRIYSSSRYFNTNLNFRVERPTSGILEVFLLALDEVQMRTRPHVYSYRYCTRYDTVCLSVCLSKYHVP